MFSGVYFKIVLKAGGIAVLATFASLLIGFLATHSMGLGFGPIAVTITVICSMVVGWPATAFHLFANYRTATAKREALQAHLELKAVHAELKRLHNELAEKHRRDSLTGVLNREAFLSQLESESNDELSGALFIIDADHFKAVNDQHGHAEGDLTLQAITSAISGALSDEAFIGRIGGEEFAVFMRILSAHAAFHHAEKIRNAVEKISIVSGRGGRIHPTISLGGVLLAGTFDVSRALRQADRNLYRAKHEGRNKTVIDNLPLVKMSRAG